MNPAIQEMLKRYKCITQEDHKNALKEIMQELALLGLWRSKFFEKAAFYGGTCLRILYGLDRFSEDLDFSLLAPNPHFDLSEYQHAIKVELESFGFDVTVDLKDKTQESAIRSAFLKANTLEHLLKIGLPEKEAKKMQSNETIKIKLEIDTDPPPKFETTLGYLLQPLPFSVKSFAEPDLFAGKLHAILCRNWKTRVKGRDWFDFVWFMSKRIPVHLKHLDERMKQSGHQEGELDDAKLKQLLDARIEAVDLNQAKEDVIVFLRDRSAVEVWSKDFFRALVRNLQTV